MDKNLADVFRLLKILHKYEAVERAYPLPYLRRLENDAEHSYTLAMLAWYIIEKEHLSLNYEKILKYCLAHDLVEVYAGDTWTVGKVKPGHSVSTKEKREKKGQQRLRKELPSFKDLHRYIDGYKKRKDPESRFVYALDKIVPSLTISLHADKGKKTLRKLGITFEMLQENKKGKVTLHPTTNTLWKSLAELLEKRHETHKIFPNLTPSKKSSHRKKKR
ncbi:MAG: HD domain-containing protein [Patescibacteria group bacterium]